MDSEVVLKDLEAALLQFEKAMATKADTNLLKAGCIQYFEFSFELAWKSIRLLASDAGIETINSPKAALKYAFANHWIQNEDAWLEMLSARNRMTHTYNAADALAVYDSLASFLPSLHELLRSLKEFG